MNAIEIRGVEMPVVEYQGQRVVTMAMVDRVHQRPEGTARRSFNEHRERLREGEDFFQINQPDELRSLGFTRPQGGTPATATLLTESGYLMLVKSFTDDLAWEVQRKLVNCYFRSASIARAESGASPAAIAQAIAAAIVPAMQAVLQATVDSTVKAALAALAEHREQRLDSEFIPARAAKLVLETIAELAKARTRSDRKSKAYRSERSAIDLDLRSQLGFFGTGRKWSTFPVGRWMELQGRLEVMRSEIKREAQRNPAQLLLLPESPR